MPAVPSCPPGACSPRYLLPGYPSEYLLLRQEPRASSAARLQKFWGKKGLRDRAAGIPPSTVTTPRPERPRAHLRGDELQPPALPILLLLHQAPHLGVALGQTLLPRPAGHVPRGSRRGCAVLRPPAAGDRLATASLQGLRSRGDQQLPAGSGSCQAPPAPKSPRPGGG